VFHVKHEALVTAYPDSLPLLESYHHWLATAGIERGLIGPREVERLWDRHIANCAVVEELIPTDSLVYDVGSGAGLPGLVLSIVRPDLKVGLIEPLLRRANFLTEVIGDLGLTDRVSVYRDRAEQVKLAKADVVTARAVAPLSKLLQWTLPLTRAGGLILAMKGTSAQDEILEAHSILKGRPAQIVMCGQGIVDPLTTVVRVAC
jgi:16S rRNA (guanine527-N7)-methyltransferase